MRNAFTIIIMIILFSVPAHTTIIVVPDDYLSIQDGIDNCINGDTVLVHPDTYKENINFRGKNIILASLERRPFDFVKIMIYTP